MKRICCLIVCFLILFQSSKVTCFASNQEKKPKETDLYAKSAVLIDADSGRVLYSKNGKNAMANASTTKIMTCIIALEYCDLNAIVTASNRASIAPKVHLGMKAGQQFYLKDLLYALMLESYNDCAVAIAEHIALSVEDFAVIMNEKAKEIGCLDTYFITPNGLDAQNEEGFHHTTAEDLAKIMRYCIMISEKAIQFREITATREYSFTEINNHTPYYVRNHNAFLDMMNGAFSGKTGFTGNAGYCYVGAVKQENKTLIVALLACGWPNNRTYKWKDAKTLINYGLHNYSQIHLSDISLDKEKLKPILVNNGKGKTIDEKTYTSLTLLDEEGCNEVLVNQDDEIKISYEIKKECNAPITEHTCVGKINYLLNGEVVKTVKVYTMDRIDNRDALWYCAMILKAFFIGW